MPSWIHAAEAAIEGRARRDGHATADANDSTSDVEVLDTKSPPILDASGVRALVAPFFAGFLWAAAVLREMLAGHPLDALALFLRLLALALTVRALLALWSIGKRLRVWLASDRYALALTDDGLFHRTPSGDVVVERRDILDVREHGDWRGRSGRRWAYVYVITKPQSGRTHVALPPVFLDTSGVLAERLMRWMSTTSANVSSEDAARDDSVKAPEDPLASKLWERLVAGERPYGVTVIEHGNAWLRRGPYASILLGIAVLDGYLRLPGSARTAIGVTGPLALMLTLVVVPLVWFLMTRAEIKPRGGIALVLTPTEVMMRTRAGVHRFRFANLTRASLESKTHWSILQGAHEVRTLVLVRKNDSDVRYTEAFLGAPGEVVLALCEAYRRGAVVGSVGEPSGAPSGDAPESTPAS